MKPLQAFLLQLAAVATFIPFVACRSTDVDILNNNKVEGWIPYKFDENSASYNLRVDPNYPDSTWMADIPNTRKLSELALPGTHNSAASEKDLVPSQRCQNYNILAQLYGGVRFLDIPIYAHKGRLWIANSKGQNLDGSDLPVTYHKKHQWCLIAILREFLTVTRNTEIVIVRFRKDPRVPPKKEEALRRIFWKEARQLEKQWEYSLHRLRLFSWNWNLQTAEGGYRVPTMQEMRGKFLVVTDFKHIDEHDWRLALPSSSSILNIKEDSGEINKVSDVDNHWNAVDEFIDQSRKAITRTRSNRDAVARGSIGITYASGGNNRVIPEVVAAGGGRMFADAQHVDPPKKLTLIDKFVSLFSKGKKVEKAEEALPHDVPPPRHWKATPGIASGRNRVKEPPKKEVEGINKRLLRKLYTWQSRKDPNYRPGIVVMDFPGKAVTRAIWETNFNWL